MRTRHPRPPLDRPYADSTPSPEAKGNFGFVANPTIDSQQRTSEKISDEASSSGKSSKYVHTNRSMRASSALILFVTCRLDDGQGKGRCSSVVTRRAASRLLSSEL
jgi:hypothetical protein